MIDDVLWLQVTVNDLVLVHIVKSSTNLLDDILSHILVDFSLLFEEIIELT